MLKTTELGRQALSKADMRLPTLQVHVLVHCLKEVDIHDLVLRVREEPSMRFLDHKYVVQAAFRLYQKGLLEL